MISVCLATYNGARFLAAQLDSILPQLQPNDELIISDDGSTDETLAIIQQYMEQDKRIILTHNQGKGIVQNFSNALALAKNEYIFLCDQDDIWAENKVACFMKYFEKYPKINVLMSDLILMDENGKPYLDSYQAYRKCKTGFLRNIIKNGYIGCAMAFRREFISTILPIPKNVPMHDMWIGLLADWSKSAKMFSEPLTYYRRHQDNASKLKNRWQIYLKLKWRVNLLILLIKRLMFKR